MSREAFTKHLETAGGQLSGFRGELAAAHFGDPSVEYTALRDGAGLIHRSDRCLIEAAGEDRLTWLSNLTTNQLLNLSVGEGTYAFALDVKGRIQFDLCVMVRPESLLIDVPRALADKAIAHLRKYKIVEDVQLADQRENTVHLALIGPHAMAVLDSLGVSNMRAMAQHSTTAVKITGVDVVAARHDFCGPFGVELFVPADHATAAWQALVGHQPAGVTPCGTVAVEQQRIEAGVPAAPEEINDDILPAETGQVERAVSYQKGCYLGQEVVERMRSRGSLARKLSGVQLQPAADLPLTPAQVLDGEGKTIGQVTSACHAPTIGRAIGLAYIKTTAGDVGTPITVAWDGGVAEGEIAHIPFTRGPAG